MASFADIMGTAERGNRGVTQGMPYTPGMPQGQVQPQMPQLAQVPPMQGQAPAPAAAPAQPQGGQPPASPEEFEQRRQGWTQVLGQFMQQPNAKQVMMMVGLKLLQGRQPGQSLGQQFGSAIGTGVMTNSLLQQNQIAAEEKLRKQQMEDEKHGLDVRRGTAQADKAEAENDFYTKTRPQAIEEIKLGIQNLKLRGEIAQAQLAEQLFNNGNLRESYELTKQDKRSAIWARNAQVDIQRKNADKVPTAQQTKKDTEDLIRRAYPKAATETPEQYDQRIAQLSLGVGQTSKTNRVADLLKLAELTEDDVERASLLAEAKAEMDSRQLPRGAPATGRGGTQASGAKTYASEAAVAADFKAGKLKVGDVVLINGKKLRVTE